MGRLLELFDSRVSNFRFKEKKAELHFSFAYIYLEHNADVVCRWEFRQTYAAFNDVLS